MRTKYYPNVVFENLERRFLFATYYVSPAGSDAGGGTSGSPFGTLQHAADLVQAGDTVIAEAGTYASGFVLGWNGAQDGTASAPITFQAQPGASITGRNSKTTDAIDLEGDSYVTVEGFTITNPSNAISRAGIRVVGNPGADTQGVVIRNNSVDNPGIWGIFTGFTDDVLIQGNTLSHAQQQHGIYVSNSSQRPVIRGNTSFANHDCGIEINADATQGGSGITSGALIEDNVVHDNGTGGGAGINLDGVQNSRVQNNLLYNNHAGGISLWQFNGASGCLNDLIVNNTISMASDARWAVSIIDGSTGDTVYNNVLYNANPNHGSIDISSDSLSGFQSDYNAVVNLFTPDDGNTFDSLSQWQAATGQDRHSLVATPAQLFVNPAGNDYHLKSGSPAVDAGTALAAPNQPPATDMDGNARPQGAADDIGAYELVQTSNIPAAPSNLIATAVSSTQINLSWTDNSNNETGFLIERSTDGVNFTQIASVAAGATTYSNSGLSGSTQYTYRVRATNSAGNSAYSNTSAATTPAAPTLPAAPSNLITTAVSSAQINLSWTDNSNNETGFLIERSTNGVNFTQIASVAANATTYSSTALAASTQYTYRVRATNSVGNSGYSNTSAATTNAPAATAPAAPSGLAAVAVSSSQVNLSWTDNSNNEIGFKIERSADGVNFAQIAMVVANVTSFMDSGLSAGTSYTYRVRATNSIGDSANTNSASATTAASVPVAPAAPSALSATAMGPGQINLSWADAANDQTSFKVERSTDGVTFTAVAVVGAQVTSYADGGLASNVNYMYRVLASNAAGDSAPSAIAMAATPAPAPAPIIPPPPTEEQKVSLDNNQIALDIAAGRAALFADRQMMANVRAADLGIISIDNKAIAADHRSLIGRHKDAAALAADKQKLGSDNQKLHNDMARLRGVLGADVLHWRQVLQQARKTLQADLRMLAQDRRADKKGN